MMMPKTIEEDFSSVLSTDNYRDFMRVLKKYKAASLEENKALFRRFQAGDLEAYKELILRNMPLIVGEVSKYTKGLRTLQPLDLIHEGVLGLIECLQTYNPDEGALSSYARSKINWILSAYVRETDDMIKSQGDMKAKYFQYRRIIDEFEKKGEPLPKDEELADLLHVSKNKFKRIQEYGKYIPKSLDQQLSEEGSELGDLVSDPNAGYDSLLDTEVDLELYVYLKRILEPIDYYFLYYRVLVSKDERRTLKELCDEFGITREAVRLRVENTLKFIRPHFTKEGLLSDPLLQSIRRMDDIALANIRPYDLDSLLKFLFLKSMLPEKASKLYRMWIYRQFDYGVNYYAKELDVGKDEILALGKKISAFAESVKGDETFLEFRNRLLGYYGTKIFGIDFDSNKTVEAISYESIIKKYGTLSFAEVEAKIKESGINPSYHIMNLLESYFYVPEIRVSKGAAEREVNAIVFGYKTPNIVDKSKLYRTYQTNKAMFTELQRDYLEKSFFPNRQRKCDREEICSTYTFPEVVPKLERIHYHVKRNNEYDFSKNKYLSLRARALEVLSREEINLLDVYYGVGYPERSLEESAKFLNYDQKEFLIRVRKAKEDVLRIYLSPVVKEADKQIYIGYLLDEIVDFNPVHRQMTLLHIRDGLSYNEIGKSYGIGRYKASNAILETIRKIDMFRHGVLHPYPPTSLEEKFQYLQTVASGPKKDMISDYLNGLEFEIICQKYEISMSELKTRIKDFYKKAFDFKRDRLEVTREEIDHEIHAHPSEKILRDIEIKILSMVYGIACEFNIEGKVFDIKEIASKLKIAPCKALRYQKSAIKKIAEKKLGVNHAPLIYMNRNKVSQLLKDKRLPIDKVERQIICYLYGLEGETSKKPKEVANEFHFSDCNFIRKVLRIILTMKKYANGEVPPKVDFETDVEPYLKFFPKVDQKVLIDLYRDNLTFQGIAVNNGLTFDQVDYLQFKLRAILKDYRDRVDEIFDYDYYYEHQFDSDIPYYGDSVLARKLVFMFFEEKKNFSDIQRELSLDFEETTFHRKVYGFIVAVFKKRDGIKKCREFSYEEIRDYFLRHQSEMIVKDKINYLRYLNAKRNVVFRTRSSVPLSITMDLLRETHPDNYVDLDKVSRQFIISFIRKYGSYMSKEGLDTLYAMYGIRSRDMMSGKDHLRVLKFLTSLDGALNSKRIELTLPHSQK